VKTNKRTDGRIYTTIRCRCRSPDISLTLPTAGAYRCDVKNNWVALASGWV